VDGDLLGHSCAVPEIDVVHIARFDLQGCGEGMCTRQVKFIERSPCLQQKRYTESGAMHGKTLKNVDVKEAWYCVHTYRYPGLQPQQDCACQYRGDSEI
jgi:hypothetical protein